MALDTVPLDRKRGLAFVAGTAGLALLHLQHTVMGVVSACLENTVMTVAAGIDSKMLAMAERQRAEGWDLDLHVAGRMASGTVTQLLQPRIILVVAGAAGFAFFHLGHGDGLVAGTDDMEQGVVTGRAVIAFGR